MKACDLFKRYSIDELVAMQKEIMHDSNNKSLRVEGCALYTKEAQDKLLEIAWAITYHLAERREKSSV